MKKYYYAGTTRIGVRTGSGTGASGLVWLFGDHLGSTSRSANYDGASTALQLYKAWGESRYASGTLPTGFKFTGQRLESSLGIYDYGARWYDAQLGGFLQGDTIIPEQYYSQSRDRYAYTYNNPIKYNDPSGHRVDQGGANGRPNAIRRLARMGSFHAETYEHPDSVLSEDNPVPITNGAQGIIEAIGVLNDLLEPYGPNPDNVFVELAYTEYLDGSVNDFGLVVNNQSSVSVYVQNAVFEVGWWTWEFTNLPEWEQGSDYHTTSCAECGQYYTYSTTGDYLGKVGPVTTLEINIYSYSFTSNVHPPPNSVISGRASVTVSADFRASNSISPVYPHTLTETIYAPRRGF